MFGNMTRIMGQLQDLQQFLKDLTVEGTAGDGMVTVVMNGQQNVMAVHIDAERIAGVESVALGQMITDAYNQAQLDSKTRAKEEVTRVTGLNLSSLPGIL